MDYLSFPMFPYIRQYTVGSHDGILGHERCRLGRSYKNNALHEQTSWMRTSESMALVKEELKQYRFSATLLLASACPSAVAMMLNRIVGPNDARSTCCRPRYDIGRFRKQQNSRWYNGVQSNEIMHLHWKSTETVTLPSNFIEPTSVYYFWRVLCQYVGCLLKFPLNYTIIYRFLAKTVMQ